MDFRRRRNVVDYGAFALLKALAAGVGRDDSGHVIPLHTMRETLGQLGVEPAEVKECGESVAAEAGAKLRGRRVEWKPDAAAGPLFHIRSEVR